MPILDILKESLLNEKLPLSVARDYVKKGRKNAEHLPDEFVDAYSEMFGNKNRIHIGDVKISDTEEQFVELDRMLNDLVKTIEANINRDAEFPLMAMIKLNNNMRRDNPQAIDIAFTPKDIESVTAAKKQLSQASLPNGGYLLKTVIKRLKPYILPEAYAKVQLMTGKLLTKASNIRMVDSAPVILSKHPYDVAGMSQGKRWESCKKAIGDKSGERGFNAHFLDTEVGHLLIAFVANPTLDKGKDMLTDPYSRLLVLPVESSGDYGLYVSSNIYGGKDEVMKKEFYNIVSNYVANFMPVFGDNDDKEMVGKYYPDSNYNDPEYQEELRWNAWGRGYNYIDRKLPNASYDLMELFKLLFDHEFIGELEINDVEDTIKNYVNERDLKDIDNIFEHLKRLDMDRDEYVNTHIGTDAEDLKRFLTYVGDWNSDQIMLELFQNDPQLINSYTQFEYLIDDYGIIPDGALDLVDNYAMSYDPSLLEENGKFAGAFVNYVIRHEDSEPWHNADDWKRNTDIKTMWEKIEDVDDFDEFYGFLRLSGYDHEEVVEAMEDSEEISEDLKDFWDKKMNEKID